MATAVGCSWQRLLSLGVAVSEAIETCLVRKGLSAGRHCLVGSLRLGAVALVDQVVGLETEVGNL